VRRLWTSQRKSPSSSIANKATACLILISFADFEYTDCNHKYTQSTTIDLWNCGALRALYCDTASAMDVRVIPSPTYRLKRSWTMDISGSTFLAVDRLGTSLHDPPLSPLPHSGFVTGKHLTRLCHQAAPLKQIIQTMSI
jgi:hypothetical protein